MTNTACFGRHLRGLGMQPHKRRCRERRLNRLAGKDD
jgi:hypothetical protein